MANIRNFAVVYELLHKDAEMNIAFLLYRFLDGGTETILSEYLNTLSRSPDCRVSLVVCLAMGSEELSRSRLDAAVSVTYLVSEPWLTAYKRRRNRGGRNVMLGLADEMVLNPLRRCLIRHRLPRAISGADAVVDFDSSFGSFIGAVPRGVRRVAWFHFSIAAQQRVAPRRMERLRRHWMAYDHVALVSEEMLREARRLMPELSSRFCRIYNGLNRELLLRRAEESVDDVRIAEPFMLAVERLSESQKDLTTLFRAYAQASAVRPLPPLYVIGEGKSRRQLEELIDTLGLAGRVALLGFVRNPYPWIRAAQCLVLSSKYEGFGLVLAEALMLDCPVISSDCPVGPREILDGGRCGVLVPVGDVEAMAEALEGFDYNSQLTRRRVEAGRELQKTFDIATSANDLLRLLSAGQR